MHHTQARAFVKLIGAALVAFVLVAILPLMAHAAPDGALLTGTVKSAAGAEDERRDRLREDGRHHDHYIRVYGRRGRVLFSGHERGAL